jgi:hypothetical protein
MPPAAEITWDQVLAWRMRRQLIDPVGDSSVPEVVRSLCGIQAQVPSSAELAIALRRDGGRVGDAAQALRDRKLIRTWAMRGTLHLLEASEAGSYLALMASIRSWERPAWQRAAGVTPAEIEELAAIVDEVLHDRVLARSELIEEIAQRTGSRKLDEHLRSGWGSMLKPLAWQGHLCNGPSNGNRVTFTKPETWSSNWRGLPEVEIAARTVIGRYLAVFGPSSAKKFAAWLARGGPRAADIRSWWNAVEYLIVPIEVEGEPLHVLAADVDELRATPPAKSVRLVAGFDQYVLGPGTDDPQVIAPEQRGMVSRAAGWISPVVLIGGRVAGVWELRADTLAVELFGAPPAAIRRDLAAEMQRLEAATGASKLSLDIA